MRDLQGIVKDCEGICVRGFEGIVKGFGSWIRMTDIAGIVKGFG